MTSPTSIIAAALLFVCAVNTVSAGESGTTIQITSQYDFCSMMPPNPGDNVGGTEATSLARCTTPINPLAVGAKPFPPSFILSAHYVQSPGGEYIQVTGQMNASAYNFAADDSGGQYDSGKGGIRPTSSCAGWGSYLNYLGPQNGMFCVRCCKDDGESEDSLCNWHYDLLGCELRVPGDYGPGFDGFVKYAPLPRTSWDQPVIVPNGPVQSITTAAGQPSTSSSAPAPTTSGTSSSTNAAPSSAGSGGTPAGAGIGAIGTSSNGASAGKVGVSALAVAAVGVLMARWVV